MIEELLMLYNGFIIAYFIYDTFLGYTGKENKLW